MSEIVDVQTRNDEIAERLSQKEKEGFKYGELQSYLEGTAKKFDTTFFTVRNIYYNSVKVKKTKTAAKAKMEPKKIVSNIISSPKKEDKVEKDNLIDTYVINGKKVRLVEDNEKEFYVTRDIFSSLSINRSSPIAKEGLEVEYKKDVFVQSTHGFVKTSVVEPEGVKRLLFYLIDANLTDSVKNKVVSFIKHLKEEKPELFDVYNQDGVYEKNMNQSEDEKMFETNIPTEETVEEAIYRYGDLVEVEVINIVSYGVFVETLDKFKTQGLIHIKNARDSYIADLNLYFEPGDRLEAEVERYEKPTKRLNLSTLHLNLPPKEPKVEKELEIPPNEEVHYSYNKEVDHYDTVLAEKLGPLKDKLALSSNPAQPIEVNKSSVAPTTNTFSSNKGFVTNSNQSTEQPVSSREAFGVKTSKKNNLFDIYIESDKELNKIVSILNKKVGALTPAAKAKLVEIISREDITLVDFIMTMSSSIPDFEPDFGLILLKEIENNLSGGL